MADRESVRNALYQQILGISAAEIAANEMGAILRLIASGISISAGGIITLTQPPVFSAASLTNIPAPGTIGGLSLATLIAGDLLVGTGASALARLADVAAGQILASGGVGVAPAWSASPAFSGANVTALNASNISTGVLGATLGGALTLLYANSGTNTTVAATTVDSVAISGLTAKDTLLLYIDLEQITQACVDILIYNVTDAVVMGGLTGGAGLAAGVNAAGTSRVRQSQSAATKVTSITTNILSSGSTAALNYLQSTFTQNWTGSWTLGLRHAGITSGGTLRYSWAVYKVAGQ